MKKMRILLLIVLGFGMHAFGMKRSLDDGNEGTTLNDLAGKVVIFSIPKNHELESIGKKTFHWIYSGENGKWYVGLMGSPVTENNNCYMHRLVKKNTYPSSGYITKEECTALSMRAANAEELGMLSTALRAKYAQFHFATPEQIQKIYDYAVLEPVHKKIKETACN